MTDNLVHDISGSIICWLILGLALVCYQQLLLRWLSPQSAGQHDIMPTLISALPLLGLLGTIIGLLDCFAAMARGDNGIGLFSQGIGDALLTTQLGLLCALPAWLLHSSLPAPVAVEA